MAKLTTKQVENASAGMHADGEGFQVGVVRRMDGGTQTGFREQVVQSDARKRFMWPKREADIGLDVWVAKHSQSSC